MINDFREMYRALPGLVVTVAVLLAVAVLMGIGAFPYAGEEDPDLINAGKQTVTMLPTTGRR